MKKAFVIMIAMFLSVAFCLPMAWSDVSIRKDNHWKHSQTFHKSIDVEGDIQQYGAPIGAPYSNVFYVYSGTGADTLGNDYGKSWKKPFATLEYAIGQCTAIRGDVIIVMPGHNEGISSAAAIDFDVIGITVIGVGQGSLMPTIDFDDAAASVAIGADNVTLFNLRFRVSANAVTVGLDIEDGADYARVERCQFGFAETATDEFAIALRTGDASNGAEIIDCQFHAGAQAAVNAILFNKDTDGTILKGNWITGTYSTAPIAGATTASTNLLIEKNVLYTQGTADTFNLVAASTGILTDNRIVMNAASAALALDIGNLVSFQNYLIADDDVGGAKSAVEAGTFASVTATADD